MTPDDARYTPLLQEISANNSDMVARMLNPRKCKQEALPKIFGVSHDSFFEFYTRTMERSDFDRYSKLSLLRVLQALVECGGHIYDVLLMRSIWDGGHMQQSLLLARPSTSHDIPTAIFSANPFICTNF